MDGAVLQRVYYATNRLRVGRTFGAKHNHGAGAISYGSVVVSLPENRAVGEIPLPPWYDFSAKKDAKKYVLLYPLKALSRKRFFEAVADAAQNGTTKKPAFIYIHGYYNTFDDAARRTGQIAVDLSLPVVPVLFSWPSKGKIIAYKSDETSAQASTGHLEAFLRDFAERSQADQIFIIAHSMGNLVATGALKSLLLKYPALSNRFTHIVLAAPDIDPVIFRKEIAPRFSSLKVPVTVYTSRRDRALLLSRHYNESENLRLGHPDSLSDAIDGIDLIDASTISTNFIGHDYIGSNRALLTDLSLMFTSGKRARERIPLIGKPRSKPTRWAFP